MKGPMLQAKYPLVNTKDFLEITLAKPQLDRTDYFCACKISAPNYEKELKVYGIDEIQCTWLALRQIRVEIRAFEKEANMKCEYRYFQDEDYEKYSIKQQSKGLVTAK